MLALELFIRELGAYTLLLKNILTDFLKHGVSRKELSRQILKIGAQSLPIVLLTAIFSGMVLALQTAYGLQRFGAKNYIGNVVGLGIVRELSPVLTAVMVCGRIGAGIAAELGSMKVTEQVDAIKALGANPITKLVTPKVIAAVIALPALVALADATGIYGGQLVAVHELGQGAFTYQRALLYTVVIRDIIDGLIKSVFFGFIIATVACHMGLNARGGTEGVGIATTKAVVIGSISIFIANFFITKLLIMFSS